MKEKIIFNYLQDKRTYELRSGSGRLLTEIVDEFINEHKISDPIKTEDEYKIVWKHRTAINGLLKDISGARKQTCAVVVNPLIDACKTLETKLQEASNELTAKMVAFKPKEPTPLTTTTITISYPIGSDEIKKVKTYLKRVKIDFKEENK